MSKVPKTESLQKKKKVYSLNPFKDDYDIQLNLTNLITIKPGLSAELAIVLGTTTISSLLVGKLVARYVFMNANVFGTTSVIMLIESVNSGLHTVSSTDSSVGIVFDLKFDINSPKESGRISPVFSKRSTNRSPLL